MKVILASKNQHKLTELSTILSQLGFEIALESEYGLDIDVEETGTTFEENSFLRPGFLSSRAWHDVCRAAERTEKRNFPQSARSAGFLQKISRGTEP